jgi:serine/threonine-protein kinase
LQQHHTNDSSVEFGMLWLVGALAMFGAALLWIYYMALEPYVRRRWPEFLISWNRLITGNFRDPMVGRDLLAGSLFGALVALCLEIVNGLPAWFTLAGQTPINNDGLALGSAGQFIGTLVAVGRNGVVTGLTILFVFFLVRSAVRHYWVAILIMGILLTLTRLGNENVVAETIAAVVIAALTLIVLLRFGLLATAAAATAETLLVGFPIALDPSRWYFARGLVPVLLCAAIAVYGFRRSFGNRPVLGELMAEDQE